MHANARLSGWGRQELVRRVEAGTPAATVARQVNVSRDTVYKWWRRAQADADGQWWVDRSSRPQRSPARTRRKVEKKILSLRRNKKLGPARIAGHLQMAPSTVHAVLVRNQISRLAWMDRPTGRVIRRYEHRRPGDLVHVDIKKLGKIPPGGGWRAHGRDTAARSAKVKLPKIGYCYVHSAVDDHSRLAYSEIHDNEQAVTAVGFWRRARAFYAGHGIAVRAVLTDNGACYRSQDWMKELIAGGALPRRTRPTDLRRTARSSASTGRCWRNGPTSGRTPQRLPVGASSTAGSIRTTITAATPPWAANHRSAVSTTCLGTTTSSRQSSRRADRGW